MSPQGVQTMEYFTLKPIKRFRTMRKPQFSLICLFTILLYGCPFPTPDDTAKTTDADTPQTPVEIKLPPFEMELPAGYKMLRETMGDLDRDGQAEKVFVLNTGEIGEMGEERILLIFKVMRGDWKLLHQAKGAVLPSEHGGVFGDPFQSVKIENGALVLKHFGGSREKWAYTHRFGYQNKKWVLIDAKVINEAVCEWKEVFDYNLSTRKVKHQYAKQVCEGDETPKVSGKVLTTEFISEKRPRPVLNGFYPGKLYAVNPETGNCVPDGSCYEYNQSRTKKTNLRDLVGTYTLGGHDQSWVVIVLPKGNQLEVSYYSVEGMLPPEINQISSFYEPYILEKFAVNTADGTIDTDIGTAGYSVTEEGETLTFFNIESHMDNQLVLTKVKE